MKDHLDRKDDKAWFISVVIASICMLLLIAGISMVAWTYYKQQHPGIITKSLHNN